MNTAHHISPSTIRRHRSLRTLAAAGSRDSHAAKEALDRIEQRYPSLAATEAPSLAAATNWRHAAKLLIQHYTGNGSAFTAGEIARDIRLTRPDLRFSCANLFRFVAGSLIVYDGWPAVEVERTTDGSSRSPEGRTFIVYAPSVDLGLRHDGEVEIPPPGPLALGAGS